MSLHSIFIKIALNSLLQKLCTNQRLIIGRDTCSCAIEFPVSTSLIPRRLKPGLLSVHCVLENEFQSIGEEARKKNDSEFIGACLNGTDVTSNSLIYLAPSDLSAILNQIAGSTEENREAAHSNAI